MREKIGSNKEPIFFWGNRKGQFGKMTNNIFTLFEGDSDFSVRFFR